ncbi:hypothetical protein PIB30_093711 [Stylosanthes scabra]|uniref:Uncharacterized protein n=1 Tax=Stylosanthes scabra TaxID=79078 RepID=A0ABU6SWR3_9FABA|nr:hypothetical protein [Stylosanthes scabra]
MREHPTNPFENPIVSHKILLPNHDSPYPLPTHHFHSIKHHSTTLISLTSATLQPQTPSFFYFQHTHYPSNSFSLHISAHTLSHSPTFKLPHSSILTHTLTSNTPTPTSLQPPTTTTHPRLLLCSSLPHPRIPLLLCTYTPTFNEELYNSIVKNKKVIAECCIDLDEDEYPEVKEQISLRGWRRIAAPKQEISIDLIHEFYANAILTEEEMEEARGHTFRSYVRGKVVDFSPENLRNVMRFRAHVQGAATDFETRKEHD